MERFRLFGAAGGAVFAILTLIAFSIAPGPANAHGDTVVEYYSKHGTATVWEAGLVGVAVVLFIWFVEIFAGQVSSGPVAVVGGAVTAALYLVAIGCFETLGETYNRMNVIDVPNESFGDAHVLYDAGVGAVHLANFTAAAFVGATAAVIVTSTAGRWLGWVGIAFAVVRLLTASIVLASESHWSDVVGSVVFVAFVAWVFAVSVWLVFVMRRGAVRVAAAGV